MAAQKSNHIDYIFLISVLSLLAVGLLILSSISSVISQKEFGNSTHYLFRQIIRGIIPGLALGILAFKLNLSAIKRWSLLFVILGLVMMFLVLVPGLGIKAGGASRWLNIGFSSLQPSEFLKIFFFIYISAWLAKNTEPESSKKRPNWRKIFLPFIIIVGIIGLLLIIQSDLSTLIVILATAGIIYFCAQTPLWHSLLMLFFGVAGACCLIRYVPYRYNRVLVLLDPLRDPMGLGYQIRQVLIAVGSGGIWGLGIAKSQQKFGFVPQPMGDSVFAIFAEETGFVGAVILVSLFVFVLWRGLRIAKKSQDRFSRLFATGFVSWICLQAFVAIGAMIGLIPLTGIPLPFISQGGTHIVAELIGVGILLNISKHSQK